MTATMKSELGGPGSGPKPGHRSPWYERGRRGSAGPSLDEMMSLPEGPELTGAVQSALAGTFGSDGLTVGVTAAKSDGENLVFGGDILDGQGSDVGDVVRHVQMNDDGSATAYHLKMVLDKAAQDKGFATAFNGQMEDWYRQNGVDEIKIQAVGNVAKGKDHVPSSVVWAKAGYDFDFDHPEIGHQLENIAAGVEQWGGGDDPAATSMADRLRSAAKSPTPDAPTPFDVISIPAGEYAMFGEHWNGVKHLTTEAIVAAGADDPAWADRYAGLAEVAANWDHEGEEQASLTEPEGADEIALTEEEPAVFGGPGSGPKPGHRSPWYERGSKTKPSTGTGTADDPIVTSNVEDAARALAEDKYVQLNQPDEVATLLDELAANVAEAKAAGEDAPNYNLCKVSVPGTNLFCVESKGIPRIKMPQLTGKPTPGSAADALPRDDRGNVNLGPAFIEHMQAQGISTSTKNVPASHLRASQNELNGAKVAGISNAIESGDFVPADADPIFVTADNYVVDGHHRWAATVGAEYATGGDIDFPVNMLDTDIITALAMANDFAIEQGIPQAAMAARFSLREIRQAIRMARITAVFGGPGSGPKPGHRSPWYERGSRNPEKMTPEQKAAEIEQIRGGYASSEEKRLAQGLAERGPDGKLIYIGELGEQRAEIVAKWVDNADPVDEPEILFMGGGPAAGKTTALTSGYVDGSPDVGDPVAGEKGEAVLVAADDLKQKEFVGSGPMGDYKRLVELGDKDAAGWIHEESSSLSKEIYKQGRDSKRNVVVDALANTSVDEMRSKIADARKSAKRVRAVYATVPTEDAVARMKERLERTGRGVAEPVVRETHAAVSRILPEISGEFDSVALIDTSGPMGSKPTLVMSNTLGGNATIHDPGLWDSFLAKGGGGLERQVASVFADDDTVEVIEAQPSVLDLYLAVLQGRDYTGPENGRVLFDEITQAVADMDGVPDMPAEIPRPDGEAEPVAEFGGPGSGPKPGHRSPWYDRGGRNKRPGKVTGKKTGKWKQARKGLIKAAPRPKWIARDKLAGGPIDQGKLLNEWPGKATRINESLRTRKELGPDEFIPINDLNEYLLAAEIPEAVTVYRGMDLDPAVADAIVAGSSFQNPGFTSTTLRPPSEPGSPAAGAPVAVEIEIPAGTKGAYISGFNGDESDEVLFPQNMNLRVDSRDGNLVKATVIEPHIPPGRATPRGELLLATEPPPFV